MAGKDVISMKEVEAQMAAYAQSGKARVNAPSGNSIGTRGGTFTYKGEEIGEELVIIALDFVHLNAWYAERFDPNDPKPPSCFALSDDGKNMEPFEGSPEIQHERCDGCPMNAWGSADRGRGKACKNQYRVACMEADSDPEEAEIAILTLAPTSTKNWDHYVRGLETKLGRPTFGVVTEFTFDDDFDYPVIVPKVRDVIDDAKLLSGIMKRIEDVRATLREPFDTSGFDEEEKPKPKRKAAPKKKAAARKSKFS